MVKLQFSKLLSRVRFSHPAPSLLAVMVGVMNWLCPCGSVVEHSLGKGEVAGPIPAMGTMDWRIRFCMALERGCPRSVGS
jgi:hypothetical protein